MLNSPLKWSKQKDGGEFSIENWDLTWFNQKKVGFTDANRDFTDNGDPAISNPSFFLMVKTGEP